MSTQDNDPLHAVINAKLASIVAGLDTQPPWYDAWQSLGPDSTEEQRLHVYQAIRDSGILPLDAGFYLVSWQIDAMTSQLAEETLREMDDLLSEIQAACGLEGYDSWPPGEAPEEYQRLHRLYMLAWNKLFVEQLERHGEQEIAQLFQSDPDGFDQRSQLGRQHFHVPDDPEEWLDQLGEEVAATMTAESAVGPLGLRYREEDGCWSVLIYLRPVELLGGAQDGEVVVPGFSLDLEELRLLFDRIDACSWESLGLNYGEGPHLSIEGVYQGRDVFLQVLAYAPNDAEPGLQVETD